MNKADFIKQVGHENEIINEQIRIIDIMLDTCAQFDGKVINKRYFDFMQKQSGTFTRKYFGFATDDSPREITLECANFGWFQEGEIKFNLRKFHDYPQCTIYPCTLGVGYIGKDRRLNAFEYEKCLITRRHGLQNCLKENLRAIELFDEFKRRFDAINTEIDKCLSEVPRLLRGGAYYGSRVHLENY